MFTIEVKKRGKDEEFRFADIKKEARLRHEDCYAGKAEWRFYEEEDTWRAPGDLYIMGWAFVCSKCDAKATIHIDSVKKAQIEIIRTAIDGEERKIADDVRVIQKT